jgi:hypothetical protein
VEMGDEGDLHAHSPRIFTTTRFFRRPSNSA